MAHSTLPFTTTPARGRGADGGKRGHRQIQATAVINDTASGSRTISATATTAYAAATTTTYPRRRRSTAESI